MTSAPTRRVSPARLLMVAASLVLLAACGKSGSDKAATTTVASTVATTAAPTTAAPTTAASGDETTTTEPGGTVAPDPWQADPQQYRGQNGKTFDFDCPAGGTPDTVWGTETYTDDSSVCTAAVQVGLITVAAGGTVTVEIAPGQDSYAAGTAHGITSEIYASWDGSFTFPKAPPGSGTFEVSPASWSISARSLGLELGAKTTVQCSPGGSFASVWGTGTYTADSSVCTAAVLEGLITQADGGSASIEVTKGESAYKGSTAHGVTSEDYPSYDLSYTFTNDQPVQ